MYKILPVYLKAAALVDYDRTLTGKLEHLTQRALRVLFALAEEGYGVFCCSTQDLKPGINDENLPTGDYMGMEGLFIHDISAYALANGKEHLLTRFFALPGSGTSKYQVVAPFQYNLIHAERIDWNNWKAVCEIVNALETLPGVEKITGTEYGKTYASVWCENEAVGEDVVERLACLQNNFPDFVNVFDIHADDVPQTIIRVALRAATKVKATEWLLKTFPTVDLAASFSAGDNYQPGGDDAGLFLPGGATNISLGPKAPVEGCLDLRGQLQEGLLEKLEADFL